MPLGWKPWVILAAVGALFACGAWFVHTQRAIGAANEASKTSAHRADSLETELVGARAKLRVDTLKLFARIDTGHTIIQRQIDTAIVHHTDTVKVTVRELVTIDSTIRACRETISECGRVAQTERARADALVTEVAALKKLQPSIFARCGVAAGYAAVYASGSVKSGPAVLAGCRVWP